MNKKLLLIPVLVGLIVWIVAMLIRKDPKPGDLCEMQVVHVEKTEAAPTFFTLIMDNSGSMKGYMDFASQKNTEEFKEAKRVAISTVSAILDNVSKELGVEPTTLCGGMKRSRSVFLKDFQNSSLFSGKVTELGSMIHTAADLANDSSVVGIVSDLILSVGVEKAKGDINYNLHHLEDLGSDIHSAATKLHKEGMDIVIIRYLSDYNGSYYCTNQEKRSDVFTDKLMKERPYYVMLIGKKHHLKKTLDKCIKPNDSVRIFSTLSVEDNERVIQAFRVSKGDKAGAWLIGTEPLCDNLSEKLMLWSKTDLKDMSSTFDLTFNEITIPSYLEQNLKPVINSSSTVNKVNCTTSSCSIQLKQYNELPKRGEVSVDLIAEKSRWDESYDVKDDATVKLDAMTGKTWALSSITNNIIKAYDINMNPQVIASIEFNIAKK